MRSTTSNLFDSISLTRVAALALLAAAVSSVGCAAAEEAPPEESSQEAAFTGVPSEYPTDSGWALAMIANACSVSSASLQGAVGTIKRTDDGVVYSATRSNEVIASAWARSTFFAAPKRCLTK